jgi:hypothetical protein
MAVRRYIVKTADELFDEAKQLRHDELLQLTTRLEEYTSSIAAESQASEKGPYALTLSLAGIGKDDWADVSSDKGKHLADVYSLTRDE